MEPKKPLPGHHVIETVENVRYLFGAPLDWSAWLDSGGIVSVDLVVADEVEGLKSGGRAPWNDVVVTAGDHRERLPVSRIERIAIGVTEPPSTGALIDDGVPHGIPLQVDRIGLHHLGQLTQLPPEPYRWLAIHLDDGHVIAFDVSDRSWAAARLLTDDAAESLTVLGDTMVQLKGLWRWICVTRFRTKPEHSHTSREILRTLLGHPAYWYGYISPRAINPYVHGPYRLDVLNVDSFRPVEHTAAASILTDWLNQDDPPDAIEGDLEAVYETIRQASECYQLPELGPETHHDTGWILHSGFCELVLIGPGDALTLVVASGD